jgi:hypothetical protein
VNDPTSSGRALPDAGNELPVLLGGSAAQPETLILISRPGDGMVHLREWTSSDWAASPTERDAPVEGLYVELERAVREGRAMNQNLYAVRLWLGVDR